MEILNEQLEKLENFKNDLNDLNDKRLSLIDEIALVEIEVEKLENMRKGALNLLPYKAYQKLRNLKIRKMFTKMSFQIMLSKKSGQHLKSTNFNRSEITRLLFSKRNLY